jgi:excisionase family DNA binding protein
MQEGQSVNVSQHSIMARTSNTARQTAQAAGGRNSSDIISLPEACGFLGIHRNTLYKLIQAGGVPAFRMIKGGRWRFRKSELEQWLEDRQSRSML